MGFGSLFFRTHHPRLSSSTLARNLTSTRLSSTIASATSSLSSLARARQMDAAALLPSSTSASRSIPSFSLSSPGAIRKLRRPQTYHQLGSLSGSGTVPWRRSLTAPPCSRIRKAAFHVSPQAVSTSPRQSPSDIGDNDVSEKLGFEKISQQFIDECKSTAILYRHKKTGAEVMSVLNDDENKVFGIVFRTPP